MCTLHLERINYRFIRFLYTIITFEIAYFFLIKKNIRTFLLAVKSCIFSCFQIYQIFSTIFILKRKKENYGIKILGFQINKYSKL